MNIIYVVCFFCSVFFLPELSFSASCETGDTSAGAWVDITARVPEGDCKGVPYIGLYRPKPLYATTYFHGENNKYRVYIPVGLLTSCISGQKQACNCNLLISEAKSKDAYSDCWGVTTDRARGSTCKGYEYGAVVGAPGCTECWSARAYSIEEDGRLVQEWVCNNCRTKYNEFITSCGGTENVLSWDNETCSGECLEPIVGPDNLGPACDEEKQCCN